MRPRLMYEDRDVDLEPELPEHEGALRQDLELDTVLGAMAGGDEFLFGVARAALLTLLTDVDAIVYRQQVLADVLEHADVVRDLYELAVEGSEAYRRVFFSYLGSPESVLWRGRDVLGILLGVLRRLRALADEHASASARRGSAGSSRWSRTSSTTPGCTRWRATCGACGSARAC